MASVATPVNRSSQGAPRDDVELHARRGKADGVQFKKPGYAKAAAKPKSPQAVVKVISQARGHRVGVLLEYIARANEEKSLALEDETGRQFEGLEGVREVYEDWRQDFERAKPGQKRPPRHVTHMIFSGACEQTPENARIVQSAVAELLQEQLGAQGFRYVTALHTDTHHPHVHVLVNNYNIDKDRPKLRINPPELLAMRQALAEKMRARGLEQHATQRRDRLQVLERIALGMEDLRQAGKWYEAAMMKAAGHEAEAAPAMATDKMLELAGKIAEEKGLDFQETNFEAVRLFLDQHSDKSGQVLGLGANQDDKAEKLRAFDAFAKRKAMARVVADLKAETRKATLPFTQARAERMAELRKLDAALIQPSAPDYQRITEQLAMKFGKDVNKVREQIRDYVTDRAEKRLAGRQMRLRADAIDRIIDGRLAAVRAARKELLSQPGLSRVEGYALGHQLKEYEKQLARLKWDYSGISPASPDEVAAARQQMFDLARVAKAAEKVENMGPWYEPTPGRDRAGQFDAFAKREAMAKIVTHLGDSLDALPGGSRGDSPLRQRIDQLRADLEKSAPDYAALVKPIEAKTRNVAQRLEYDARKAAHPTTPDNERAELRQNMAQQIERSAQALHRARLELMASPLPDAHRQAMTEALQRQERVIQKATQYLESPKELRQHLTAIIAPPVAASRASVAGYRFDSQIPAGAVLAGRIEQHHLAGRSIQPAPFPSSRSPDYGLAYNLNFDPAGHGKNIFAPAAGADGIGAAQALSSVRELSSGNLVQDQRPDVFLPNHAHAHVDATREAADGVRRPENGMGEVSGRTGEERRQGLERIDPTNVTQAQLADLLQAAHSRLREAGAWDGVEPFRSAYREAVEGRPARNFGPELDAFAKRRAMIEEADKIKALIDGAGRVDFTPEMRRELAAIRELRDELRKTPSRDLAGAVSRLVEKTTADQLRIEKLTDKPPASATEALEQRRAKERIATRSLRSIEEAKRVVQAQPGVPPMARMTMTRQLDNAARVMANYAGRGRGL